jgi:LPXTG-site transpeptidase (sortase) family protein
MQANKTQSFIHNPKKLKPVFGLGAIALLLAFGQAWAETPKPDAQSTGTSEEIRQLSFWIEDPRANKSFKAHTGVPDKSLWNAQRVKDYEDSLLVNGDPPIGMLTIAEINVHIPIYNGSEDVNLDRGVGRIKGMAWLDEPGNLGIAGHRDGVFRGLKDIKKGDEVEVLSVYGVENYKVSSISIVEISDVSVLEPTSEKTLTLVTCYPFYHVGHAPQRYIVVAKAID